MGARAGVGPLGAGLAGALAQPAPSPCVAGSICQRGARHPDAVGDGFWRALADWRYQPRGSGLARGGGSGLGRHWTWSVLRFRQRSPTSFAPGLARRTVRERRWRRSERATAPAARRRLLRTGALERDQ